MLITEEARDLRDKLIGIERQTDFCKDWVTQDSAMRRTGQRGVEWVSPIALPPIGDSVIVWPGCATGRVVDYSLKNTGEKWERAVWVKMNEDFFLKLAGQEVTQINDEVKSLVKNQNEEFKKRLIDSGKKVIKQAKERHQRAVTGSHLVDKMVALAVGMNVSETGSFHKIGGSKPGIFVYVAKKGGRVDLCGFNIDHAAVEKITEEEAKKRHIGRIRGHIDFSCGDDAVMEAYNLVLKEVK